MLFSKGHEVSRETLRLLPMKRVSGAVVDQQLRSGDGRHERVLIAAGTESVPVSPYDQRGRFDPAEFDRMIIFP
jgi:hypothetical protein